MRHSRPLVIVTQSRMGDARTELFEIEHTPVIKTERLPFNDKIFDVDYEWLVLTSPNSVEHFIPFLNRVNYKRLASIGRKTSQVMRNYGLNVDFEPSGYTQEKFMEEFEVQKDERILYPVSTNARPLMYNHLVEAGADVVRLKLYRPVPNEESLGRIERLMETSPYAVTFSSPSGVDVFMNWFGPEKLENIIVVAIGHVTHDALKKYHVESIQPEKETLQNMFALIENGTK
ncbi:uroporphyrinogen-III synthase [Salinicoccus sp. HZC-1]|uniref:uroporphyrinogen-III synthase n=1 Tax=Salinicoccus sp. HZC-1 TaxID=3385497 RepID=UPI00398A5C11